MKERVQLVESEQSRVKNLQIGITLCSIGGLTIIGRVCSTVPTLSAGSASETRNGRMNGVNRITWKIERMSY